MSEPRSAAFGASEALRADGHALVYLSEAQRAQKARAGPRRGLGHVTSTPPIRRTWSQQPSNRRRAHAGHCVTSPSRCHIAAADALSDVRTDMLCRMHQMREDPT